MDNAKLTALLRPLDPFLNDTPPTLPGFNGFAAVSGERNNLTFLITVDHDGQIEASLSTAKIRTKRRGNRVCEEYTYSPARADLCAAFFEYWGHKPVDPKGAVHRRIRHYVVRHGKTQ